MKQRDEQGRADNRPEDREGLSGHLQHERLAEAELTRDPRPEQRADETAGRRCAEPSPGPPARALPTAPSCPW